ncbi:MAG TPA: hypothetical protein PLP04_09585 [Bryobacteraceae bacterium]|nr:hypothetical protein [Bryobacteraceae bacterium]HPQ15471.1 hypothetical protein [Bryobacteraceae bacterium]
MASTNILRYGSEEPLPEKLLLQAGPLTMTFVQGEVRYIRFGEHEVLRRVYIAVRDRNWNTAPNEISNLSVKRTADGFAISYDAVSRMDGIDFRWSATVTGDARGTIEWTMRGKAHSTFWRNRIGYCVLHPVRECAGRPCILEKTSGAIETSRFPELVSPHQPFKDLRAISHEVVPGLTAEVRFSGDIFETEDQRNWTDASYKTYSTPLDLPIPVEVKEGTEISQSVRLSLIESIVFSYNEAGAVPLPEIGLGRGGELREPGVARLRALNLSHLRADLDLTADYSAVLAGAVRDARALNLPLELAITFSSEAELAVLAARLREDAPRICRWLIFRNEAVAAAQKHLAAIDANARFVCGSDDYFAELNRNRPDPDAVDGVCFPLSPQVHTFDNDSMVENLPGGAGAARSARLIAGLKPVVVSPVTLKPRPHTDARQGSLFAAAWTTGSIKYLAEGGASSITYYETTGPKGVMDAQDGRVFPLYHVLADAGEFAGGEVLPSQSTRPLAADGVVLREGGRVRILLANMTCGDLRVTVEGIGPQAYVKRLDETNAERAMAAPEAYRNEPGEPVEAPGGRAEFQLAPYAVLRIDFERESR